MLTRGGGAAAALAAALLLVPATAHADDPSIGGDDDGGITADVNYTSQQDGYDGHGGGPKECVTSGTLLGSGKVPCSNGSGWWSNTYNCYMRPAAIPAGVAPRAGMVLWACDQVLGVGRTVTSLIWLPEGQGPGPDPATVIRDRAEATLPKPAIGITPPAGSGQPGLVGLPTWLWVEGGWSPVTITATAGPMWITATATVRRSSLTLPVAGLGLAFLTLLDAPALLRIVAGM